MNPLPHPHPRPHPLPHPHPVSSRTHRCSSRTCLGKKEKKKKKGKKRKFGPNLSLGACLAMCLFFKETEPSVLINRVLTKKKISVFFVLKIDSIGLRLHWGPHRLCSEPLNHCWEALQTDLKDSQAN